MTKVDFNIKGFDYAGFCLFLVADIICTHSCHNCMLHCFYILSDKFSLLCCGVDAFNWGIFSSVCVCACVCVCF